MPPQGQVRHVFPEALLTNASINTDMAVDGEGGHKGEEFRQVDSIQSVFSSYTPMHSTFPAKTESSERTILE